MINSYHIKQTFKISLYLYSLHVVYICSLIPSFSTVKDYLSPITNVEVSYSSLKVKARLLSIEECSEHSDCVWGK